MAGSPGLTLIVGTSLAFRAAGAAAGACSSGQEPKQAVASAPGILPAIAGCAAWASWRKTDEAKIADNSWSLELSVENKFDKAFTAEGHLKCWEFSEA
jgi:hypothetical protein